MKTISYTILLLAVVTVSSTYARPVKTWSYQRLLEKADAVLIVEPVSTRDIAAKPDDPYKDRQIVPVESVLKILGTLKGDPKADEIRLIHYRLKDGVTPETPLLVNKQRIVNGPLLIRLRHKGEAQQLVPDADDAVNELLNELLGKPEYLFFLKQRKDGRFEPVTGQYDSELSIRPLARDLFRLRPAIASRK